MGIFIAFHATREFVGKRFRDSLNGPTVTYICFPRIRLPARPSLPLRGLSLRGLATGNGRSRVQRGVEFAKRAVTRKGSAGAGAVAGVGE